MGYTKKSKFTIAVFLLVIATTGVFTWEWRLSVKEREWIQTLKHSKEPDLMAYTFLRYLKEDKIEFAKELVVPDQRERIDRWAIDSKHEPFNCTSPYWGFNQILASGGGSSKEIDKNTISQRNSYTCNFNEISISVNDVIVHYSGSEWVIIDWSEICETTPSKTETCYQ